MGTEFQIILVGDDEGGLKQAANQALDEVERIDAQMSLYRPDSELSWLNAHAAEHPVPVEPSLWGLLCEAQAVWQETAGAFDITVGPLMECWGFFRGPGTMPSANRLAGAKVHVGMQHIELNSVHRTVHFKLPSLRLDLGGIAKGFAVDRVIEILRSLGVTSALVHAGWSTVYGMGYTPDGESWPVGIRHPLKADQRLRIVRLADQALSTSGSYEKFFEHAGVRYSHILDPRTGWPVQGMLSASAVTRSAWRSDALSTAFFVMAVEQTRKYCATHADVGAVVVPEPAEGEEVVAIDIGGIS
ncbi:MAG: FAD:protein FMN transferase [Candidatus Zipacnadales bacterium]